MSQSNAVIETDDDNSPYPFFPNFETSVKSRTHLSSPDNFVNSYALMLAQKQPLWPRGYPLELINAKTRATKSSMKLRHYIQQGLIDKDTDVDAIYRLTNNSYVKFKPDTSIALAPHTYAPMNSQNTYWEREAYMLMYLPITVSSRVTDIYRGYIAQRLVWELGGSALFLSPAVYQIRNPHNYLHDFAEELPIYLRIREMVATLEATALSGSIDSKMLQIYTALLTNGFVKREEIACLKLWLREVSKIG